MQLRPLHREELGVAAVVALIALNTKISGHGVETLIGRE